MEKMKFRGHETFFIRKGWLNKGIRNILKDPYVFMGVNGNPSDILGLGTNMVKSLRYWLQAVGLTREKMLGKKMQELTEVGVLINENDPYIEEFGTLALLHYFLATNSENATTWYFFFNVFKNIEFTKEELKTQLKNYINIKGGGEVSERVLEDDCTCLLNTYIPRIKSSTTKVTPENNIDCPLGELNLVDIVNKKEKIYKKAPILIENLNPLIVLAMILYEYPNKKEIKISTLLSEERGIGKLFNLDIINLLKLLYSLERKNYIKVVRTAGLDVIRVTKDIDYLHCISEYYNSMKNN